MRTKLQPVLLSVGVLAAMGTLTAYAPTLYDLFCRVTGIGGTTQVAASADGIEVVDRTITIRFDANTAQSIPWGFRPKVREVEVKLGEVHQIDYRADNEAGETTWGTATYNVSPPAAGAYFNKIACFCFTRQELLAGAGVDMPVQFFVDPEILQDESLKNLPDITLSYTFFPQDPPAEETAAVAGQAGDGVRR